MVRAFVLALLIVIGGPARAAVETADSIWGHEYTTTKFNGAFEACVDVTLYRIGGNLTRYEYEGQKPSRTATCYGTVPHTGETEHLGGGVVEVCPANFGPNTITGRCERSVDQCPPGKVENQEGVCEPAPCAQKSGQGAGSGYFKMGSSPTKFPPLQCDGGCQVIFDGYAPAGSTLEGGSKVYYALGDMTFTGQSCAPGLAPSDSPSDDLPPPDCGEGQVLGSVNGNPVCADTDDGLPPPGPPTPPKTTDDPAPVDNGDGTTTDSETTTTTNPDGSTTTTTITKTCDQQGNCQTTTETEGPTEDDKPTECELNPLRIGCQNLDRPAGPGLPTSAVSIAGVVPQFGWGADNGTCPAKVSTQLLGDVDVFHFFCTYASGIRPFVIGVAWVIAALIFIGRTD